MIFALEANERKQDCFFQFSPLNAHHSPHINVHCVLFSAISILSHAQNFFLTKNYFHFEKMCCNQKVSLAYYTLVQLCAINCTALYNIFSTLVHKFVHLSNCHLGRNYKPSTECSTQNQLLCNVSLHTPGAQSQPKPFACSVQ